jgi:hypothetical protein
MPTSGRIVGRILQLVFLAASGWFGEWSWFVSAARAIIDMAYTRSFSAFPRLAIAPALNPFDASFWYGLTWRVAYYRGATTFDKLFFLSRDLSGLGTFLLIGLSWTLYEIFLKRYTPKQPAGQQFPSHVPKGLG